MNKALRRDRASSFQYRPEAIFFDTVFESIEYFINNALLFGTGVKVYVQPTCIPLSTRKLFETSWLRAGITQFPAADLSPTEGLRSFCLVDGVFKVRRHSANSAKALDEFWVDYIELTSPVASEQSRADCEAVCKLGMKAKMGFEWELPRVQFELMTRQILTHIRFHIEDAKVAVQTGVDGVNVVMGMSPYFMEHSHGKDMTYITRMAIDVVPYVKSHNLEVQFSGENTFRSNLADVLSMYSTMDKVGVNRVGVADIVGCASARQVYNLIRTLRSVANCDIETHFHNNIGCAIANADCALETGATHISTSVLGIGEWNGITPLGGMIARMIVTDRGYIMTKYKVQKLKEIEDLVARAVETDIPFNNYITGSCAFTHKAGIHAKAILNNSLTYEILNPEDFGVERHVLITSRLTGWNAIKYRATQFGLEMSDSHYKKCAAKIKQMADVKAIKIDDTGRIIRVFHQSISSLMVSSYSIAD